MRKSLFIVVCLFLVSVPCAVGAQTEVTLEKIMSHPRWIGLWPEEVRFAPDGQSILAQRHADPRGYEILELDRKGQQLAIHPLPNFPSAPSRVGKSTIFEWRGDLYLSSPRRVQLTRSSFRETQPRWLDRDSFVYKVGQTLMIRNVKNQSDRQVMELRFKDKPEDSKKFRSQQQDRLFPVLRERESDRKARQEKDGIPKFYLGKKRKLVLAELSNDQSHALVVHTKTTNSKRDIMPKYINRDGYVQQQKLRAKVAEEQATNAHHTVTLLNLKSGARQDLSFEGLPTYAEGRHVRVQALKWSRSGRLALFLLSQDFEERWLVEVDFKAAKLQLIEHLHDPAWHSWDHNEFGWTPDGETFWYQSEKTGYAHLYLWDGQRSRALTEGNYETSSIQPSPDGKYFYFRANKQRPSRYDVYRVDRTGRLEQVSSLGGQTSYQLSPDGQEIVILHSKTAVPPEIYLQKAQPKSPARQISHFASQEFLNTDWTLPDIVAVPSTHHSRDIPAKLYRAKNPKGAAVVFVHGAGYLQNSDEGWSYYFREFMFHTLLARMGVTVLDMDYRASAGYGREWRTAIYRQMGTPELEDLKDGVAYLVKTQGVDPKRVGVYGGSYGGFMTLMALFKEPDLFACGAALRPVTDWAHYEHEYTARILNIPKEDPEAFNRSSPIEFAEGLKSPLLLAHGMLDDNVVVQDTIRLAQRLIQLKKENWEMALYPVEPHGFVEPESWLDEYRRVFKLFKTHLDL